MSSKRSKRRRLQNEVHEQLQGITKECNQTQQICSNSNNECDNFNHDCESNINLELHDLDLGNSLNSVEDNVDELVSKTPSSFNFSDTSLKEKLADWSVTHNISHLALNALLKILKPETENLPLCSKTLLKTPRTLNVTIVAGGKYYYFGLACQLKKVLENSSVESTKFPKHLLKSKNMLSLSISTDGLPICKSSNISMWPILVKIDQLPNANPLLVALFCGEAKPSSISEFLNPFVNELKVILCTGIIVNSVNFSLEISGIIADAPARSFVKCVKGHTAYHGCERCEDEGEYFENRVIYSIESARKRTNTSFRLKQDEDHHQRDLFSPFIELDIDMVDDFVLDYMHLVCLGVTRKLIFLWLSGPLSVRLSSYLVKKVNLYLETCRETTPVEFARKPRSLKDIHRYKATEFRQFVMYTGPSALYGVLRKDYFAHFLYLHCAMKILLSNKASVPDFNALAKHLLEIFVKKGQLLYGKKFVIYNVHNLLHLADDGLRFGNLDFVSAFPFENYMQRLKRYVRGQRLQLEQVVKRVYEESVCRSSGKDLHLRKLQTYIKKEKVIHKNFMLNCKLGNNSFVDKSGRYLMLKCINKCNNTLNCIVLNKKEVEWYPIPSKYVDVFIVSKTNIHVDIDISEVIDKCMLVRHSSNEFCVIN